MDKVFEVSHIQYTEYGVYVISFFETEEGVEETLLMDFLKKKFSTGKGLSFGKHEILFTYDLAPEIFQVLGIIMEHSPASLKDAEIF